VNHESLPQLWASLAALQAQIKESESECHELQAMICIARDTAQQLHAQVRSRSAISLQVAARAFLAKLRVNAMKAKSVERNNAAVSLQRAWRLFSRTHLKHLKRQRANRKKARRRQQLRQERQQQNQESAKLIIENGFLQVIQKSTDYIEEVGVSSEGVEALDSQESKKHQCGVLPMANYLNNITEEHFETLECDPPSEKVLNERHAKLRQQLIVASRNGHQELVQLLLERRAPATALLQTQPLNAAIKQAVDKSTDALTAKLFTRSDHV
jgi:hypothetical protein